MKGIFSVIFKDGHHLRNTMGKPSLFASMESAKEFIDGSDLYPAMVARELNEKELYILEHTGYLPTVIER
jgi:hypothetical protein